MRDEFFTSLTFDFLWEAIGAGELPYPLNVRSHGETRGERSALRRRAEADLAARGILDSLVPEWLRMLARPSVSVDALHIPEFRAPTVAALTASNGGGAVVAIQNRDGVHLRPIYPEGVVSAIVDLLPVCSRGAESSCTLPMERAMRTSPAAGDTAPRGRDADPGDTFARLLAQPRWRGGQLAANSRDDLGKKRRSPVLAWFDTATGRYLSLSSRGPDGTEWVTVSPADARTLRTRLGEMLTTVSG
ncbi:ESX secretion-associated protein EspG [Saccharomonospora sp. NPDC006951]